jgi:hypothetical protein
VITENQLAFRSTKTVDGVLVECPSLGLGYDAALLEEPETGGPVQSVFRVSIRRVEDQRGMPGRIVEPQAFSQVAHVAVYDRVLVDLVSSVLCHRLLRADVKRRLRAAARVESTAAKIELGVRHARAERIEERNNETAFYRKAAEAYIGAEDCERLKKRKGGKA